MSYTLESLLLPDGYRNSLYCWEGQRQALDCLLYLHGIESHAGWFIQSAEAVNALDWPVVLAERRGSGCNSQNRGHADSFEQLLADVFCAAAYCRDRWPSCQVHLAGVSWGGKLALASALRFPQTFASLTMIAPGIFPRVDLSIRNKLKILVKHVVKPTAQMSVPLEDARLFTDNPQRIAFIEQDKLRLHRVSAGFFWASYQLDKLIQRQGPQLNLPIHLMLSGADRIIDSEKTKGWFECCKAPEKHLSVFPDSAHTLEFDRDNRAFLKALTVWLDNHSQRERSR